MNSIAIGADPLISRRGGLIEAEVDGELVALHEELVDETERELR